MAHGYQRSRRRRHQASMPASGQARAAGTPALAFQVSYE